MLGTWDMRINKMSPFPYELNNKGMDTVREEHAKFQIVLELETQGT